MKFFVTLCLTFLMIYNVNAYEDNEGRITRFKFYQDMRTFSNGTMDAGVDPFNGLYCKANDFIEKVEELLMFQKIELCVLTIYFHSNLNYMIYL